MEQSLSTEAFCFDVYGVVMLAEDAAKIGDDKGLEAIVIKETTECVVFLSESWIEREMGERSGLFGFLPTEDHRRKFADISGSIPSIHTIVTNDPNLINRCRFLRHYTGDNA